MDSPSSLGVVIPCHKPYIPYLRECLDSIELQTTRPGKVLVVCSQATPEDIPPDYLQYSFPLQIVTREDVRNQAQNRNQGVTLMETPYISFFDADDIMHPQRIELILKSIGTSDILFHGYSTGDRAFSCLRAPTVVRNQLVRGPTGCVIFAPDWTARLHHSQITLRRTLLETFRFCETPELRGHEDALFCGDIVASGVQTAFLPDSLSWYRLRP